ncbi:MAG: hypothetical protein LKF50_00090 [Solobacterium sp.]|nr:hypothetical protein [Solobacterium sp.]
MDYVKTRFKPDVPIFLDELIVNGVSRTYIRQRFAQCEKKGEIARYDNGIYYIPRQTMFGESRPFFDDVLSQKYISNEHEVYGFFTGLQFENKIGLSDQIPVMPEIVTNRESTRRRIVTLRNQNVILRKPVVYVTNDNVTILQFLDLFRTYPEYKVQENIGLLKKYISDNALSREMVQQYLPKCSEAAKDKLIESGLIYEFI